MVVFAGLRLGSTGLAVFLSLAAAEAAESMLTVQGEGSASRRGAGQFSATLPNGLACTATFSGGKISLFGQSAAKGEGTCRNGEAVETVRVVVSRRLNGSPREATLSFRDGTKVLVEIPKGSVTDAAGQPAAAPGGSADAKPPPLPEIDLHEGLAQRL